MELQLLLLMGFALAGCLLFILLLTLLELDELLLKQQSAVPLAKRSLNAANSAHLCLPAMVEITAPNIVNEHHSQRPQSRIKRMPLRMLQHATAHFSTHNLLHAGSSADIFLGSLAHNDNQLVAIKRFEPPPITSPHFDPFFLELLIHTSIHLNAPTSHSPHSPHPKLHTILTSLPNAPPLPPTYHHHNEQISTTIADLPPLPPTPPSLLSPLAHHQPQQAPMHIPSRPHSPQLDAQRQSFWTSSHTSTSSVITSSCSPSLHHQHTSTYSFRNSHTASLGHCDFCCCEHPPPCSYFMPLLGYCLEKQERLLVYEYAPNKDLATALEMCRRNWVEIKHHNAMQKDEICSLHDALLTSWITRLKIATQVAQALAFLHHSCQPPIAHRGLKASSILLTRDFDARLASFNEARTLAEGELPLYDIYCYGQLLLYLILGSNATDSIPIEDFFKTLETLNDQTNVSISQDSLLQLVDPCLIIEEDFAREVLGVALLAKACLQVKTFNYISMLIIVRCLKDPTKVLSELLI